MLAPFIFAVLVIARQMTVKDSDLKSARLHRERIWQQRLDGTWDAQCQSDLKPPKKIPFMTVRPVTTNSPPRPDLAFYYHPFVWPKGGCSLAAATNEYGEVSSGVPAYGWGDKSCMHDNEFRLDGYTPEQTYSRMCEHGSMKCIIYVWFVPRTEAHHRSWTHTYHWLWVVLWFEPNKSSYNDTLHNKGYGEFVGASSMDGKYFPWDPPVGKAQGLYTSSPRSKHLLVVKDNLYSYAGEELTYFAQSPELGNTLQFKANHLAQWEILDEPMRSTLNNKDNWNGHPFPLADDVDNCSTRPGPAMISLLEQAMPEYGLFRYPSDKASRG